MFIRTGFFIEDSWTGVRGRVIALPADGSGDFLVLTPRGVNKVQAFNAEILSYVAPAIGDVVRVTNGAQNFVGSVVSRISADVFEMELCGLAGTVAVHTSQMYQLIAQTAQVARAS
jgi:hypothetical protein